MADGLVAGCMAVSIFTLATDLMRPGRFGFWLVRCLVSPLELEPRQGLHGRCW